MFYNNYYHNKCQLEYNVNQTNKLKFFYSNNFIKLSSHLINIRRNSSIIYKDKKCLCIIYLFFVFVKTVFAMSQI